MLNKMVVIPSDPLAAYEKAGYLNRMLEGDYFNPDQVAKQVIIASPYESGDTLINNIRVVGVRRRHFNDFLQKEQPDVIRAYGSYWACDLAVFNSPNTPVMVSVHDTKASLFHRSLVYADRVMAVSPVVKDICLQKGVPPDKVEYVPNWVDLTKFRPRTEFFQFPGLPAEISNAKKILHVGRKARQKNIPALIESLNFLPQDYVVIFVGRGNDKPYKRYARKLGVADRCFWLEHINSDELPLWYSHCDVFCTPSKWEGFGIVFIEAAACGAAIVTSDIAPMNQILPRDGAVFVKKYKDGKEIARAIEDLLRDPAKLAVIKQNALEASKLYSKELTQKREAACIRKTASMVASKRKPIYSVRRFIYRLKSKIL